MTQIQLRQWLSFHHVRKKGSSPFSCSVRALAPAGRLIRVWELNAEACLTRYPQCRVLRDACSLPLLLGSKMMPRSCMGVGNDADKTDRQGIGDASRATILPDGDQVMQGCCACHARSTSLLNMADGVPMQHWASNPRTAVYV